MENDGRHKKKRINLTGIIILSVALGLALGLGLWFWQKNAGSLKDEQTGNGNSRVVSESTKPLILENNPPDINSKLESVGDKLSEALFHLREQQMDAANQTLAEADEIAAKADDDPQLQQNLLNGIKQVQNDLKGGKSSEAEEEINSLLNQLDMPEN